MKHFLTAFLGAASVMGFVACGDDEVGTNRLPEAPVLETTVPGIIFLRGPEGEIVPGNEFDSREQVHLVGAGLEDGDYYYQVVDDSCEVMLAGPNPVDPTVPDTSDDVITVDEQTFGPMPIAPFNRLPDEDEFYAVYLTPVTSFSTDLEVGCFGFPDLESLTAQFRVDLETEPVAPGEPVEPVESDDDSDEDEG